MNINFLSKYLFSLFLLGLLTVSSAYADEDYVPCSIPESFELWTGYNGTIPGTPNNPPRIEDQNLVSGLNVNPDKRVRGTWFVDFMENDLDEEIPIFINLPASYLAGQCKPGGYPVLYLTDADRSLDQLAPIPWTNIGSYLDEMIDEYREELNEALGSEFIVVGVSTSFPLGSSRNDKLFRRLEGLPGNPRLQYETFVDFIANKVIPRFTLGEQPESLFGKNDRNARTLLGVSSGAMFVLQFSVEHPELIGNLVLNLAIGAGNPDYVASNDLSSVTDRALDPFPASAIPPEKSWDDVMSTGGLKVYIQYGPDATRGLDANGLFNGAKDVEFLESLGFVRIDRDCLAEALGKGKGKDDPDCSLNHPFLVIDAPSRGLKGTTHDQFIHPAYLDGLLLLNGHSAVPENQPFHLIRNPQPPLKPVILAVTDNSVTLRVTPPKDVGLNFGDTVNTDDNIERWKLSRYKNGMLDSEVVIDHSNINTTIGDTTCIGNIHRRIINLIRTTPIECMITDLDPGTTYQFEAAVEMRWSLFDDATGKSRKVRTCPAGDSSCPFGRDKL